MKKVKDLSTKNKIKLEVEAIEETIRLNKRFTPYSGFPGKPIRFLESILLTLKKNGVLASKKGKGGGYYLLKRPNQIKISTVIRVLEGPIAMLPCVSLNYYEKCDDCLSEDRCSLNRLMVEVRDNTLKILENKTLEDFHCGT